MKVDKARSPTPKRRIQIRLGSSTTTIASATTPLALVPAPLACDGIAPVRAFELRRNMATILVSWPSSVGTSPLISLPFSVKV